MPKLPKTPAKPEPAAPQRQSPARAAHDRLILWFRNFENQLDATQEMAVVSAGDEAGILRIEGLGFSDPDIITFYGRDEHNAKTQLIQHVSQLSVTLRAVRKNGALDEPPRRIGFHLASGWMGGESGDASV